MRRTLTTSAVALGIAAVTVLAGTGTSSAAEETRLKPAQLERGEDVAIAHLEGKTIVDGDLRIKIRAGVVRLLGTSGNDYVIGTANKQGNRQRTRRVDPDGRQKVLFRGVDIWEQVLSADGSKVAATNHRKSRHTYVNVYDTTTGANEKSTQLRGYQRVLDFEDDLIVLGGTNPGRTVYWDLDRGETGRLAGRAGYAADIATNRLATYTRDPYDGGCTVVSTLTKPRTQLWTSCRQRVEAFNPTGDRMATIHILSDGLGPADVWLRTIGGKRLAHYTARWFGRVWWESSRALLLDTNGAHKSAIVRCVVRDCERASDLEPAHQP